MDMNLTKKELDVLNYINETNLKKYRFKINTTSIADHFSMSETHAQEMVERFKEKGLIKKKKNSYSFAQVALEVLAEGIFSSL